MARRIRDLISAAELRKVGTTPDYRFSLANERTFLAWIRTALALVGGGLAVDQFLPDLEPPHLRVGLALTLIVLGGLAAGRAVVHWIRCERAMRLGEDLPPSRFPGVLAGIVVLGSIVLIVVVVLGSLQ